MASTPFRIALCTAPSTEEATRIANHLVEHQLAACVNIVPGLTSIYRWQGAVESASEVLMLIKTTESRLAEVEETIRTLHSYEVPEFVVLGIDGGSATYLEWLTASVAR